MSESEERLKRVEILLETCAKMTVNHDTKIQQLTDNQINYDSKLQQLTENVDRLTLQMASLSSMFTETVGIIRSIQLEVKGIQTENQRILSYLFGENQEN